MPVLLEPQQALPLHELLAQLDTQGLSYTLPQHDVPPTVGIRGIGSLGAAGPSEISFLSNPRRQNELHLTDAAAVILSPDAWQALCSGHDVAEITFVPVLCEAPYAMYAMLAQWFDQHRIQQLPVGIHATAVVDPSATLGPGVSIGPYSVIEADAVIGQGCYLGPHTIMGAGATLGAHSHLHARVTLYHGVHVGRRCIIHSGAVLGADGFGFAPDPRSATQAWVKIAQVGGVRVGDDVEIGANTTIDRGALEDTAIGSGVKLDNQIMIAHNVHVGDHTAMAACVGVAGSTHIGRYCTIGGAAMLSGHLRLADDVHVSGGTAITSSITASGRYTGVYPYAEHRDWQKNAAVVSQLGSLRRRLRKLERTDTTRD